MYSLSKDGVVLLLMEYYFPIYLNGKLLSVNNSSTKTKQESSKFLPNFTSFNEDNIYLRIKNKKIPTQNIEVKIPYKDIKFVELSVVCRTILYGPTIIPFNSYFVNIIILTENTEGHIEVTASKELDILLRFILNKENILVVKDPFNLLQFYEEINGFSKEMFNNYFIKNYSKLAKQFRLDNPRGISGIKNMRINN